MKKNQSNFESWLVKMAHETPAKFLLGVTLKSNTSFICALFILFLTMMWALRNHRQRRLEIMKEEKTDQMIFIAGSFFFLLVLVPFMESFRREPYSEQVSGTHLDDATEMDEDLEYSVASSAVDSVTEVFQRMASFSSIDRSIAFVVCLIVCIVTFMAWPKTCDYCPEPMPFGQRSSSVGGTIPTPSDVGSLVPSDVSMGDFSGPVIRMYQSKYK